MTPTRVVLVSIAVVLPLAAAPLLPPRPSTVDETAQASTKAAPPATLARIAAVVAGGGDVNGDGYADVLVGDPQAPGGARAQLYLGNANGLASTPAWSAQGTTGLGASVAILGDVNGDGYADVAIGIPGAEPEGRVSVYHGSAAGLAAAPSWTSTLPGDFGSAVAAAGDVNGDGYSDLLVGAPSAGTWGTVYLFLGSVSGLQAAPVWSHVGVSSATTGQALDGAGDVNGDGFDDIVIGFPSYGSNRGRAVVFYGASTGAPSVSTPVLGLSSSGRFGSAVARAGDVNGDGYADIVVGAPNDSTRRVLIYLGSGGGIFNTPWWTGSATTATGKAVAGAVDLDADGFSDVLLQGRAPDDVVLMLRGGPQPPSGQLLVAVPTPAGAVAFASSIAGVGDIDGDGYGDVAAGGVGTVEGGTSFSAPVVGRGSGQWPTTTADVRIDGDTTSFASSLAIADVNADGFDDLVVGSSDYSGGQVSEGRVELYLGTATGVSATRTWTYESNQMHAALGESVANAGDVNGDGYADVVVGAPRYPALLGSVGRALVFTGTASGLSASPAWFKDGSVVNGAFGQSVAGVGDVNGDGFGDVLIGSPGYSAGQAGEGAAFLFYGASGAPSGTAAWHWEPNAVSVSAGRTVSGAGDVNGDGFADVLVGVPDYDVAPPVPGEGGVAVFYGSATGLPTNPSAAITDNGFELGASLSAANDVNGDGFADVLAGRRVSSAGPGHLLLGSALGLSTLPVWSGARVAGGTGDINGDGWPDVPTQRSNTVIELFAGNTSGALGSDDAWSLSLSLLEPRSKPIVGDFDGDGWGDLVIGSYEQTGSASSGVLRFFHGNRLGSRRQAARQLRGDASSIHVQPWGSSGTPTAFKVELRTPSFLGRARSKVEVEACPAGVRLGAVGCRRVVSSTWRDTTDASPTVVLVDGLLPATLYRWRARALRAPFSVVQPGIVPPPAPAHGPWRRPTAQTREADIRTLPGLTADISVTVDNGTTTSVPGTIVSYQIRVANAGPSNVAGVRVSSPLPFGLTGATWTCIPSSGSACVAGPIVGGIDDSATIVAGGHVAYTLQATVRPDARGTLVHTATIQVPAEVIDAVPSNNTASDTDLLNPLADMRVTQADSPDPVPVAGSVAYTVTVANGGPSDANSVVLTDVVPAGTTLLGVTPSGTCQFSAGTVTCNASTVTLGSSFSAVVTVRAQAGFVGLLENRATVSAIEPDPVSTNNTWLEQTRVRFAKGDANNDLATDLYFRRGSTGEQMIWYMSEVARVGSAPITPTPASLDWRTALVDDFNGDAWNDLAMWNTTTGVLEFWMMAGPNGASRLGSPVALLPGSRTPDWKPAAGADFNNDGKPDILWRNTVTQRLEVWLMNGTSMFATRIPSPDQAADSNWEVTAALDYNGDNLTDLLWYNTTSGRIVLWLLNADLVRVTGIFTNPASAGDNNWKVVAGGDYGVGPAGLANTKDIVWRNETSGKLVVWHMDLAGNRTNGRFTVPDSPTDPLDWMVVGPK